jgi:hypothetical protein
MERRTRVRVAPKGSGAATSGPKGPRPEGRVGLRHAGAPALARRPSARAIPTYPVGGDRGAWREPALPYRRRGAYKATWGLVPRYFDHLR